AQEVGPIDFLCRRQESVRRPQFLVPFRRDHDRGGTEPMRGEQGTDEEWGVLVPVRDRSG
ncbi:hypothetical protein ACFU7Z_23080, partial [Kitasatospora sp. NPDC057518]|uniref:hypothetical protein n=1 Tax=Kitasatospora sp. NPDC057518 TaxID=3346155 RepID=UPI0036C10346